MNKFLFVMTVMFVTIARAETDKTAECLPVANSSWSAMVEVFDDTLSGKPKYEAAKKDPSEVILRLAKEASSGGKCAEAITLYGSNGLKALFLKSFRSDLAKGKFPRMFD